jgi:quercetin dioxygenase-like cupin family protein
MAKRRKAKAAKSKTRKSRKKVAAKSAKARSRRKPQRFTVSHHREEDFDQGLRPYSAYRDLGIAPATGGMVQAHVIRMTKPFSADDVAIPHYHDVDFQMVYVLKGSFTSEFEGQGVHTFHAGSCWIQPPKIRHTVRGYSDDCELLEIVLPAEFETVTLKR